MSLMDIDMWILNTIAASFVVGLGLGWFMGWMFATSPTTNKLCELCGRREGKVLLSPHGKKIYCIGCAVAIKSAKKRPCKK
jgi:hypothetical protein